jgi:hypothetical protein
MSDSLKSQISAPRFGDPSEIAQAIVFFASDEAAYTRIVGLLHCINLDTAVYVFARTVNYKRQVASWHSESEIRMQQRFDTAGSKFT